MTIKTFYIYFFFYYYLNGDSKLLKQIILFFLFYTLKISIQIIINVKCNSTIKHVFFFE